MTVSRSSRLPVEGIEIRVMDGSSKDPPGLFFGVRVTDWIHKSPPSDSKNRCSGQDGGTDDELGVISPGLRRYVSHLANRQTRSGRGNGSRSVTHDERLVVWDVAKRTPERNRGPHRDEFGPVSRSLNFW